MNKRRLKHMAWTIRRLWRRLVNLILPLIVWLRQLPWHWLAPLKKLNLFRYIKRMDRYIIYKFIGTYFYSILLIISMRYSYFLNGVGALRLQLYMTVSAIVFIPLAWAVSSYTHDILWFMAVMCLCNIPGLVVNVIQFNKILNGQATGIWRF